MPLSSCPPARYARIPPLPRQVTYPYSAPHSRPVGQREHLRSPTATIPNTGCALRLEVASLLTACDRRMRSGRFVQHRVRKRVAFPSSFQATGVATFPRSTMRPLRIRRSQATDRTSIKSKQNTKIDEARAPHSTPSPAHPASANARLKTSPHRSKFSKPQPLACCQ
jgi:hypothetical protein